MAFLEKIFGNYSEKEVKRIKPTANKVMALEDTYAAMSDEQLQAQTPALKERLAAGESLDDILPDAFAVCREAAWRVLGMKHFEVQVIGGIILHQGRIAEMKTGEGKTLVATLPAYLNGLTGRGVHIVTVNDYLARRDSEWMGKLYNWLGLSVGLIIHEKDDAERRQAYQCDITYGTNNEMGFDYLRDNMVVHKANKVQQKGHVYGIVDEVDSILIDEARTPLIISGRGEDSSSLYEDADRFAKTLHKVKVKEMAEKEDNDALHEDADYIVDEKAKTATLTRRGVAKAEAHFGVENLMDSDNMTLLHHIDQAIKANGVMQRDIDYVVKDGEVLIVDEFTGRIMLGRRYNEGLHQAIEAKEGVKVRNESKTLATITFQNYFRLYEKLSGMTGTALTESDEFQEIYSLDAIETPTNKPVIRVDHPDVIYRTEQAKFAAVVEQIRTCHEKGQPVLVGTISIEKSELISKYLRKAKIKHEVLNAKQHEREAAIVAQAGKFGAVTIATNMAGRGTDIMLGGNSEFLAKSQMAKDGFEPEMIADAFAYFETDDEEILAARNRARELEESFKEEIKEEADKVRAAGGLYILGTERHESRRIDNQLRGRSGRQGDPGESRFFLSLEDDLLRLFGGQRIDSIMGMLNVDDDTPIENKMLSKTIENAQLKVEGRNFAIRKQVLQYDDVMNKQREIIYEQRDQVLNDMDLKESIMAMLDENIAENVKLFCNEASPIDDWNLQGLKEKYIGWLTKDEDFKYTDSEKQSVSVDEIVEMLTERGHELYESREQEFGSDTMRELERVVLLRNVDTHWMDHIDAMEELKQGIGLRAMAQRDPVVEFRLEGFDMFDEMTAAIREDTVRMMLTLRVHKEAPVQRKQVAKPTMAAGGGTDGSEKAKPVRKSKKIGPNDPCPCGSGKKYKKCCMQKDKAASLRRIVTKYYKKRKRFDYFV